MLIKELKVSRNGFTMGGNHILQFQGPFSLKSIKSNLVFFYSKFDSVIFIHDNW